MHPVFFRSLALAATLLTSSALLGQAPSASLWLSQPGVTLAANETAGVSVFVTNTGSSPQAFQILLDNIGQQIVHFSPQQTTVLQPGETSAETLVGIQAYPDAEPGSITYGSIGLTVVGAGSSTPFLSLPFNVGIAIPTPTLSCSQPGGPGSPVTFDSPDMFVYVDYHVLFSLTPCSGPPGGGPYLGLCSPDPALLVDQFLLPLGTYPFHFSGDTSMYYPTATTNLGNYLIPPGITFEYIVIYPDYGTTSTNIQHVATPVQRYTVQ